MTRILSILLLLTASSAQASIQSFKADDPAMLHPVSMTKSQPDAGMNLKRGCRPVLLFLRLPDGRAMLIGVFQPKEAC
jgi:hypothetical protein